MASFDTTWMPKSFHLGIRYDMRVYGNVERISPTRIKVTGTAQIRQPTSAYGYERIFSEVPSMLGWGQHKPYTTSSGTGSVWSRDFYGEFEVGTNEGNWYGQFHARSISGGGGGLGNDNWITFGGGYPIGATPPTGLAVSNVRTSENSVTATVKVDNWGNGANSNLYRELQVGTENSTNNQYLQAVYGWDKSGDITVSPSSIKRGVIELKPNTKYYLGLYAYNGAVSTHNFPDVIAVTLATAKATVKNIKPTSVMFSVSATDGYRVPTTNIQYRQKGQEVWKETTSISTLTGNIEANNLISYTEYEVRPKVNTTDGTWYGEIFTFRTKPNMKVIYPDGRKRYVAIKLIYPDGRKKVVMKTKKI